MAIGRSRSRADFEVPGVPRNDAYTGLLGLSLGAMIVGCILLYMDYSSYPSKKPDPLPAPAPKVGAAPQQGAPTPAGGNAAGGAPAPR